MSFRYIPAFVVLFGCGTVDPDNVQHTVGIDTLVAIRTSGCPEVVDLGGMYLALCGELAIANRHAWITQFQDVVAAEDEALELLGLPRLSSHLFDSLVRVYDAAPGARVAGEYLGYKEPETKSISLWIRPDSHTPHQSALAHEFMHLYDHHEFLVGSLGEWYVLVEHGRHFMVPIIATFVAQHGRAGAGQDPPTILEALVCGGVGEQLALADAGGAE